MLYDDKEQNLQKEFFADSAFTSSAVINAYNFEKGMREYENGNYIQARSLMAKARAARVPQISNPANKVFIFMNQRDIALRAISDKFNDIKELEKKRDEYNEKVQNQLNEDF